MAVLCKIVFRALNIQFPPAKFFFGLRPNVLKVAVSEVVGANGDLEWPDYDLSRDANTNVVIQQQVDAKLTVRRSIEEDRWYNVAETCYAIIRKTKSGL